jgi:hypothetical protein
MNRLTSLSPEEQVLFYYEVCKQKNDHYCPKRWFALTLRIQVILYEDNLADSAISVLRY